VPPRLGNLEERRKLPKRSPGRKLIVCISEVRKKPPGNALKYFWAMAKPPNVVGPGKLFSFSAGLTAVSDFIASYQMTVMLHVRPKP